MFRFCLAISLLFQLFLFRSVPAEPAAGSGESMTPDGVIGSWDGRAGLSPLSAEIRKRIEQAKFYPDWARSRGIEGTVKLLFTLSADGSVMEVKVLSSSGFPILDKAAIEAVERAAPYPVVEDWPGVLQLQLSITYRLNDSKGNGF